MINETNDPSLATDSDDLLHRAYHSVGGYGHIQVEFNFPAGLFTMLEVPHGKGAQDNITRRYAELTMLQLALVNEGLSPSSAWIIKAYEAGWRYRIGEGFHKVTA